MTGRGALDLWEAGLRMTPAERAVLLLSAAGHPDLAEWPVGRRNRVLLGSLPPEEELGVTRCPDCDASLEIDVDVSRLTDPVPGDQVVTVDRNGYHIVARVPTVGDLQALETSASLVEQRSQLFDRCVLEASDHAGPVETRAIPDVVGQAVEAALESADPGGDLQLELTCVDCAARWSEALDPVRFAWAAIESTGQRLATDVHTLACAYGWSEQSILDLSPFRRHLYLSAVQG